MPPLWCTLAIVLIVHSFLGDPFKISQVFLYMFNIQGINHVLNVDISNIPGMAHTWFVTVIALCYAAIALLKHFPKIEIYVNKHIRQCFVTAIIAQICLAYCGIQISLILQFFIGYFLSDKEWISKKVFIVVTINSIFLGIVRIILRIIIDDSVFYDDVIAEVSFNCLAIWIIMVMFYICSYKNIFFEKIVNMRWWRFLDSASYPLYLVHYMFLFGETRVSNWVNGGIAIQTVIFACLTLLSACFVMLITREPKKML